MNTLLKTPQEQSPIEEQQGTIEHTHAIGVVAVETSDAVQVRSEHSRSVEDAEKFKALAELQRLGALVPLKDVDTYHGRLGIVGEQEWSVDPGFKNGGNDSGNSNVFDRPALYTSNHATAKEFGSRRGGDIARNRLEKKITEEIIADTNPQVFRQQRVEADIEGLKVEFDSWTDEQRNNFIDVEKYPGKIPGFDDLIVKRSREEFAIWKKTGEIPEMPDSKLTKTEIYYAVREREREVMNDPNLKEQYAQALTNDLRIEVHEIVSNNPDALVVADGFKIGDLSDEDTQKYVTSMSVLLSALTVSNGSPLEFGSDSSTAGAFKQLAQIRRSSDAQRITDKDIDSVALSTGIDRRVLEQLSASANAQIKLLNGLKDSARFLLGSDQPIAPESYKEKDTPISAEYIARFMEEMGIVGVCSKIDSVTVAREIDAIALFDLGRVNTQDHYSTERHAMTDKFSGLSAYITSSFEGVAIEQHDVVNIVTSPYSKPQNIVDVAKKVPGYAELFDASAGNWEGYTLGEHTETVLRNFDENYADKLPVELLAPMKMALLVHDIGKSKAVMDGQKHRQKEYNLRLAEAFMQEVGIDRATSKFINGLIGDGADYATQAAIFGRDEYLSSIRKYASEQLTELMGEQVTPEASIVDGYLELAEILVTCDGGAYTQRSVTRRKGAATTRNAQSFDSSFKPSTGLSGRDLELVHGNIAERSKNQ